MTPAQCRAARAALNWTRERLAEEARVGRNTVARFEAEEPGRSINESTKQAIERCLALRGYSFPDDRTMVLPG